MNNLPVPAMKNSFPSRRDLGMAIHSWLDGSQGTNRNRSPGVVKQIAANTDIEAIEAWLKNKRGKSEHTIRSYRREAYRLYVWSIAFREKPISSLDADDVGDFVEWLESPVAHKTWVERGWVLFGPKSKRAASSVRQSFVILQGMYRWLCETGYLSGNPFKVHDGGAIAKEAAKIAKAKQRRFLPHDLWVWLQANLDTTLYPPDNRGGAFAAFERQRFILTFLYWTGLRRFELSTAVMSQIQPDGDDWVMLVVGKGRTEETADEILILPPAMEALRRYRIHRGLPGLPSPDEDEVPLVAKSDGTAISDNYLNRLLKDFLRRVSPHAGAVNSSWPHTLKKATAHWMRHTLATHNAEAGVPMQTTADQLRHASLQTTRRIYTHVDARKRRPDLSKLIDYNEEDG